MKASVPERLIEYINHFLDRGYVVSLLMDLHWKCSVNHSNHKQYYSEAGLHRQNEKEDIILLLSILFPLFLPLPSCRDFGPHRTAK